MEKTAVKGSSRNLYRRIRESEPRKLAMSRVFKESYGSLIHNQQRRLKGWIKLFEEQFN